MAEFIDSELQTTESDISVELVDCQSAPEFIKFLSQLEADGDRGMRPVIQLECHGDADTGLEFANGSELSWDDLSIVLSRVNIATKFNLIAIVSACFGAYFIGHMNPLRPAPCYALISPSSEITPHEIKFGLCGFYRNFLSGPSVDSAIISLQQQKLVNGFWFAKAAEDWFLETLIGYIQESCSRRASIERAANLNARWRAAGMPKLSQNRVFEMLRQKHKDIPQEAFDSFFSLQAVPENAARFENCLTLATKKVQQIRDAGTHII